MPSFNFTITCKPEPKLDNQPRSSGTDNQPRSSGTVGFLSCCKLIRLQAHFHVCKAAELTRHKRIGGKPQETEAPPVPCSRKPFLRETTRDADEMQIFAFGTGRWLASWKLSLQAAALRQLTCCWLRVIQARRALTPLLSRFCSS